MIKLTSEQLKEIHDGGWPPRLMNASTGEVFVLLHAALFERVRRILESQDEIPAIEETYPAVSEVLNADESMTRESA